MTREMEGGVNFEELNKAEKKRLAHIEGRSDLFETKLFKITSPSERENEINIFFATRDPGSASALIPIMEKMYNERGLNFQVMADGRAQEIVEEAFVAENVTPQRALEIPNIVGTPDIILTDSSTDQGLETFSGSTYYEVPLVLIEDYYSASIKYLNAVKERDTNSNNLRIPDLICVMDEEARSMVIERFPEYANRVVVSGQPRFDKISEENTGEIEKSVRETLGISPEKQVISYMAQMESKEMIEKLAENLQEVNKDSVIIFRRHPRDNVPYDEYKNIFKSMGIQLIDSSKFSTAEINAASDIVITGWSTEGLDAIYRKKATVHITDEELQDIPSDLRLPLPPVKLGASMGVNKISELPGKIKDLQDKEGAKYKTMLQAMEKNYPADGKNTDRVFEAIHDKLKINI